MRLFDARCDTYFFNSEATQNNNFRSFHDVWIERGIVATSAHVENGNGPGSEIYDKQYRYRERLKSLKTGSIILLWVNQDAVGDGPTGIVAAGILTDPAGICVSAHDVLTGKVSPYACEEFQRKVEWKLDLRHRSIPYSEIRAILGSNPRSTISLISKEHRGQPKLQPLLDVVEERGEAMRIQAQGEALECDLAAIEADSVLTASEKLVLQKARIGQGRYRQDLLSAWNNQCAVTGCSVLPVLRASHAKPWREANNAERLDRDNGLPLIATLDALFDRHLICFDDLGTMHVSPMLTAEDQALLDLPRSIRRPLNQKQRQFLAHHRRHATWY